MLPGLNKRQVRFCRRNLDAMDSIRVGAKEAYAECQYQFQKRRYTPGPSCDYVLRFAIFAIEKIQNFKVSDLPTCSLV